MNQRILRPVRIALLLALPLLTGCAFSISCDPCDQVATGPDFNNSSTLFDGHQQGESKRHADDWAGPLAQDLIEGVAQQACR